MSNCNILRDDGLSYGDYVKQLTLLLFLKIADEHSRPPFTMPSPIPDGPGRTAHSSGLAIILIFLYPLPR
jgi:hypothetical protein